MTTRRAPNVSRRAFVGGAALAACLARPGHAAGLTLRVSATPSIFKGMFEQLAREFRKANPGIDIELTASARDQNDQLQGTLRRAMIRDLPDVSFEGLNHLRILQRRGIAVPLGDFIRGDPEWNEKVYAPSLIEAGSVDRSVVGLGTAVSVPILYYNADVIAGTLGQNPMPQQWDALLALVERVKKAKPGIVAGFCQHAGSDWMYMALVESLGGSMMRPDEKAIAFDEAPGRRALAIYQAFGRAGQAQADMGRDQARQAFVGGAIGILVDSSSSLATLAEQVGQRFKLGTARIPLAPNGRVPAAGIASILMARDPARQRAAWRFLKFVAGPQGQTLVGRSTGYFPANNVVIRQPDLLGAYYDARPLVRPIIETLPFASRWYAFPGDNSAKIDDIIIDGVTSVVTLTKTPDEALVAMKRRIESLLPKR